MNKLSKMKKKIKKKLYHKRYKIKNNRKAKCSKNYTNKMTQVKCQARKKRRMTKYSTGLMLPIPKRLTLL